MPERSRVELLTVQEAAEYANITIRMVRRLVAERRVPFYKIGKHVRLAVVDLDHLIEAGRVDAA